MTIRRTLGACALAGLLAGCGAGTVSGQEATVGEATPSASTSAAPSATPTSASPSPKPPKNAEVGQPLNLTDGEGLSAAVTLVGVQRAVKGKGSFPQAAANGTFVAVDILVEVTSGTYDFNPFYFRWQAADANTFDASNGNAISAGFEPALSSGSLEAGQKTRGKVTFDVPVGAATLQLTKPSGGVIGQWSVPA